MRWIAVLALLVACHDDTLYQHLPPAPAYTYAPAPVGRPLPRADRSHRSYAGAAGNGRSRRSRPDAGAAGLGNGVGIPGSRALVEGTVAMEMIDIDGGNHLWRDTTCKPPIVGISDKAIVCAGDAMRGISLDGMPVWSSSLHFVTMTESRIVADENNTAIVIDANTGKEISRMVMPAASAPAAVIASCSDGHELFAKSFVNDQAQVVQRIVDGKLSWSVDVGVAGYVLNACSGDSVLVQEPTKLIALSRSTGQRTGVVDGVRGWWAARDGSGNIEIASDSGIAVWSRDLSAAIGIAPGSLPGLGALIATHGDKRLVRATPQTAVLLDKRGVAAFLAMQSSSAAIGERAIVTGSWNGPEGIRRIAIPEREQRRLRIVAASNAVSLPAELRDLPTPAEPTASIDLQLESVREQSIVAIDPDDPSVVYLTVPSSGEPARTYALVAFDLRTKKMRWKKDNACGSGLVGAIAFGADIVACGTSDATTGTVVAYSRAGEPRWTQRDTRGLLRAGAATILVFDTDARARLLDAATGRERLALPDGRAAVIPDSTWGTIVVNAERDRIVARSERADFAPMWSLAVDGVVSHLTASADSVLVELADGDAYRVRASDGAVTALPAIGGYWVPYGDLLARFSASTPSYGAAPDRPPVAEAPAKKSGAKASTDDEPLPPRLWEPVPPPADAIATTQLTIFDPAGGVRARNDYALRLVQLGVRTGSGAPLVLYGPRLSDGRPTGTRFLVVDGKTGDPVRSVEIETRAPSVAFSTMVDGASITGAVVADPLRILLF